MLRDLRRALRSRWDVLAVIAAGGAVGSLARWGLGRAFAVPPGRFPWATFVTNVSGCLLIGALMVFVLDVWPPSRYRRPFLGVGVLGGFTTFSTYLLDTHGLLAARHPGTALTYLVGSLVAGLAAVWLGIWAGRAAVVAARARRARTMGEGP